MLKCKTSKADSPDCGNNTTTPARVVVSIQSGLDLHFLEMLASHLANRTFEVVGKCVGFHDVAAHIATPFLFHRSGFLFRLFAVGWGVLGRAAFHHFMVVFIGHRVSFPFHGVNHARKHYHVCLVIYHVEHIAHKASGKLAVDKWCAFVHCVAEFAVFVNSLVLA